MQISVDNLGIVHFCRRGEDLDNELADGTYQNMAFVTVILFFALLCSVGINILMAFFFHGLIVP